MTDKLLSEFQHHIESFTLIPSSGGVFEVAVDGTLIYSKKETGRHAVYAEVREAFLKVVPHAAQDADS
ncbi:SelT/SelW/selH family protein [Ardenticatena maritima]|uniref:SelT/SelW/selH family protein n=1 Tax=Ardenticatena maritima TaxID=872965 RepID=A0A0P6YJ91_9CHLR|nr:SelT/SelW/selH family protein [Ardenticatena maritima]